MLFDNPAGANVIDTVERIKATLPRLEASIPPSITILTGISDAMVVPAPRIEHVLPETVELVHGPGCPVCVIPMGRVDAAIAIAETPDVIFTSFGDMMRVPGGNGNLLGAKARGADTSVSAK